MPVCEEERVPVCEEEGVRVCEEEGVPVCVGEGRVYTQLRVALPAGIAPAKK